MMHRVFAVLFLALAPAAAEAGAPVLYFSDLDSGPKSGLGDGLGEGAIVTVWGVNLGDSQGSSTVTVGGVAAAHVYYWGPADGRSEAGPADLYSSHRVQTISLSISSLTPEGTGAIEVAVGGVASNALPFTTLGTGRIFYVKTTGSDAAGDGSWSNPWRTLGFAGCGAGSQCRRWDNPSFQPGTMAYIVYAGDGVAEDNVSIYDRSGTAQYPVSVIAYPGASVVIGGTWGIGNWNSACHYWSFAKLSLRLGNAQTAIGAFKGSRVVANELTNAPGGCADGQSGALAGGRENAGGIRALGNYIHDWGCDSTSKLEHVFYISNRGGSPVEAFELGWNYLRDNKAHHGLHVYDEGICGDFSGTMRIHDNVVVNQVGVAVGVASGGTLPACFTMPVEVYNNLFINAGLDVSTCSTGANHNYVLGASGGNNFAQIRFYNNTIYGYGRGYPGISPPGHGLEVENDFAGTWEWVNNIVVDTEDLPFEVAGYADTPDFAAGNLWWSVGGAPPPAWDASALTADPAFVDPAGLDFRLQSGSPARNAGSSTVAALVGGDLAGTARPEESAYDIGAYEFVRVCASDAECTSPAACRTAAGASCSDGSCVYPPAADGTACAADDNACTVDSCEAGRCTHTATAGAACEDGDPCTGPDLCGASSSCEPGANLCGACQQDSDCPAPLDCQSAACVAGACVYTALADGSVCAPDANDCTADECRAGACGHFIRTGAACEDGDACTGPDSCSSAGVCVAGTSQCEPAHGGISASSSCAAAGSSAPFAAIAGVGLLLRKRRAGRHSGPGRTATS